MFWHLLEAVCLALAVVTVCIDHVSSQSCDPLVGSSSKCSCQYSDASGALVKRMNFEPLGKKDKTAAFPYKSQADYKYAYNPCFPFSDGFCTGDIAACQVSNNEEYHFDIGDADQVTYGVDNSDIVLTYVSGGRSSIVNFVCDETALNTATYQPLGENPSSTFKFRIGTCLACLTEVANCHGSSGGGGGGGGLSPGGVMCIIFTVLVIVYIAGGMLFQMFARGATGNEMFPNYGFWSDFPALIKDGFMFLIGLCKGGGGGSGGDYESIK